MTDHLSRSVASPEPADLPTPDRFPEMKLDAETLVIDAMVEHRPTMIFVLFSGGNDSKVLLSWAKMTFGDRIDAAVFIDTGTALPGVREFVDDYCVNRYMRLLVYEAGDQWERMTADYGMPGPGGHLYPYVRLKERQIDRLVRDHKQHRSDRIMLLSGARASESERRMGNAVPVERDGAQVWVNPLIDWTDADMRAFREEHQLEESPVAALMHRSGECNCGAYAAPGEREMLRSLYPEWFAATIATAEARAEGHGQPCRWGERRADDPDGRLRLCACSSQLALDVTPEDAAGFASRIRERREAVAPASVGAGGEHTPSGVVQAAPEGPPRGQSERSP